MGIHLFLIFLFVELPSTSVNLLHRLNFFSKYQFFLTLFGYKLDIRGTFSFVWTALKTVYHVVEVAELEKQSFCSFVLLCTGM